MIGEDKRFFAGWWLWVVLLVVISAVVFGVLRYLGLFGQTVAERVIFENSFQYSEARKVEDNTITA